MQVRVTFKSEVYIEGENLDEIREKWEEMNLHTEESKAEFVELEKVEDAEDYSDLTDEFGY